MTKHAHPRLHLLLEQLLSALTGEDWQIRNPLWAMTKRQAVVAMQRALGRLEANALATKTQSCWALAAPLVFGVRSYHGQTKLANTQCGVCVPCIIRRTALPSEDFAFDLNDGAIRGHAKLAALFMDYADFALGIHRAGDQAELRRRLPAEALQLIDDGFTDLDSLESLLRAFAKEFLSAFRLTP